MPAEVNVVRTCVNSRYYNDKPIMVLALDDAVEALADSGFVRDIFKKMILDKLERGETLTCEREGRPWIEYRLAKPGELVKLIDAGVVPGVQEAQPVRRRNKDYQFVFTLPKGDELANLLRSKNEPPLTKQQRIMLKAVADAGHETLGIQGLTQVLETTREELKLDKDRDLAGIFRGHCKYAYTRLGLVRVINLDDPDNSENSDNNEDEEPTD